MEKTRKNKMVWIAFVAWCALLVAYCVTDLVLALSDIDFYYAYKATAILVIMWFGAALVWFDQKG